MAYEGQLLGGLATGFVNAKNQAQQRALMEDYRKAQTDMIKIEAKKMEAALELQKFQAPIYAAIAKAAQGEGGGLGMSAPAPSVAQPPGQMPAPATPAPGFTPMSAPATPQSLPDMISQGQMNGKITIPGDPANNISVRQNNPFNLKFVGQPEATGAGTRGFAIFPNAETGVQAGIKQLQLDQSRGLTFGQFAEKYAPSYENPGWAADVAKLTGANLNTPLAQIPLPVLASAVAKRESSTDIAPMLAGMQTAPAQTAPQPQALPMQAPRQGGITGQKLLEGFLKKNFGVEPDEAHVVPYGDHKLVVDKKGNPMFIIAGQGKMEMIDATLPDGSVVKRPMLVPPSPLPGGIPVYNLPGQATGANALGAGGMMTKPPEVTWDEVSLPGGGKQKIPVPKAQMGMPPIPTDVAGLKPADMGRMNMVFQANNRVNELNSMLFPNGEINRTLIMKAPFQGAGGGIGEGATFTSKMYQAVDSALRLETGAQANEQEIKTKMKQYWPNPQDTDSVIKQKMADLNEYVKGVVNLADPTGEIRKMRSTPAPGSQAPKIPAPATGGKPKTAEDYLKMKGLQ